MPANLYLTAAEAGLFQNIAPALREGFTVTAETLTFADSPARQKLRLETMYLTSPKLRQLANSVTPDFTMAQMGTLLDTVNPQDINETDLGQLFFGLGPDLMGVYISAYLKAAQDDDDLMTIAALTQLRHLILESLISAFAA